ncbi:anti-repressor SinI family protein [Salibacterium sp. K-3]
MGNKEEGQYLDKEWVALIDEAKNIGLSPEEVLVFLADQNQNDHK